jgi:cell division protein FtsA
MKADEYVVGLDFGTTKICAVVGQIVEANPQTPGSEGTQILQIMGVGRAPSTGIKKGVVVNIESTVESIRKAVEDAERMAGVDITKVVVGVAGSHIKGYNSSGVVGIKGKEIERNDIERVIDAARAIAIPADRMALHVLPQEFKLDDQDGIRDPMGMMGTRLEVKVHIVTAAQSAIQNIIRCCQKTGLQVASLVLQPLASAKAVLSQDEMELGVALVDIGGGTTDLAIFHGGSIVHTAVLPLGGTHISQDLAIGLRTPQTEADRLKIQNGCALRSMIGSNETIEVPSVGGRPARIVDRKLLGEIIEPRLEEIFQLVNREILASGCSEILGGGVVLTGGTTLLPGIVELAEFIFDLPVKTAQPQGLAGFSDIVASPSYSTGVGLVQWGAEDKSSFSRVSVSKSKTVLRVKDQLKSWFQDVF